MISAFLALSMTILAPAPKAAVGPNDWPQWRGPNRDGQSSEKGLLKEWPKEGPQIEWTVEGCGGGYSSVAIVGGFIYGTGKLNDKECLWCRSEADGKEVWNTPFAEFRKVGYEEGVRSTPSVANGKVYCVGVSGDLICADAAKGEILWRRSYLKEFGGKVPGWGYSESVLVDGDKVICAPGSKTAAIVALSADKGDVLWQTEIKDVGNAFGYSSAVKMTVNKVEMYVTLLGKTNGAPEERKGGVVGVDAKTGKLLWQYGRVMNGTANIPTAVIQGDLVWASTGYGDGGAALIQIVPDGDGFKVEEKKYYESKELQNHHGGMVLVGDYIFFGNKHNGGIPVCVEMKTGEIKWKQTAGAGGGSGSGSVIYADGMLYFRYENAKVALVTANPEKFELKGVFDIPQKSGKPSWAHLVIANGKLYIRDQDKMHCYNIKNPAS
jgi:outer membrane protein assembly factor BamB